MARELAMSVVFFEQHASRLTFFRLGPDAARRDVTPVAWFAGDEPLRSGWAWGQHSRASLFSSGAVRF